MYLLLSGFFTANEGYLTSKPFSTGFGCSTELTVKARESLKSTKASIKLYETKEMRGATSVGSVSISSSEPKAYTTT